MGNIETLSLKQCDSVLKLFSIHFFIILKALNRDVQCPIEYLGLWLCTVHCKRNIYYYFLCVFDQFHCLYKINFVNLT